jgi:hypothetical protein
METGNLNNESESGGHAAMEPRNEEKRKREAAETYCERSMKRIRGFWAAQVVH